VTGGADRHWSLTSQAFEKLLATLDADRELAGAKYENIRHKLLKFFQWRGCQSAAEYADRTIDRVARRLEEGEQLRAHDPYRYFHGVALNVWREHAREPEAVPLVEQAIQPMVKAENEAERLENERRLECLEECLRRLPPESRQLLAGYHHGVRRAKIRARENLAAALQIPLNALRIRVHRLRASVAECVRSCIGRGIAE